MFRSFLREESCLGQWKESKLENEFLDYIRYGDKQGIEQTAEDPAKAVTLSQNWLFVKKCAKEVVGTGNKELIR